MTIYVSAALTAIGIVRLFMEVYDIPAAIFAVTVTVLTVGTANAFLRAWQKGGRTTSRGRVIGLALHAVFILLAIVLSYRVVTTMRPVPARIGSGSVIAVLPFSNMSANADDEYFSDGITEDILTQLSKIADLRVISRTSVMQYKGTTKTIREIADELGAGSILEGSVRRAGNRLRIVSQLIDAATDAHLWSETYDRELTDVFAIQSDVAQQIARALSATLSADEKRLIDQKPTENLDAYAFYLRGRDLYYRYAREENEQAIVMFRKAIETDPEYALAYAGLADAYGQRVQRFQYAADWADSALALSRKAIALNSEIAEPYKSLGLAFAQKFQYREAIKQYEKAIRINPSYSTAVSNLGLTYLWLGYPEKALPLIRKAIILSPERFTNYSHLGTVYEALGVDSLAEFYLGKAIEINPDLLFPQVVRADKMVYRGDLDGARSLMDSLLGKYPDDLGLLVTIGEVEVIAGNFDKAEEYFRRSFEFIPLREGPTTQLGYVLTMKREKKEADALLTISLEEGMARIREGSENYDTPLDLTRVYSIRGDTTQALHWLRRAIDGGWILASDIEFEPFFGTLRKTRQFWQILDALKARVAEKRRLLEEAGELY